MSSEKRIQASRANGARSRGPVSAQGKLNSSKNSTRHGILAHTIVLDSESKTRFEELLGGYTNEFQPRTPAENTLVETMAIARWRQLRVCHIQRATIDVEMARNHDSVSSNPVRAAAAFRDLSDKSRTLDVLLRYETAFERQFTRALNALMKLQTRPNRENAPGLPPQTGAADPESPEGGTDDRLSSSANLPNEPTNPLKTHDQPDEPERAVASTATSRAATARERSTDEPEAEATERCIPKLSGTNDASGGAKAAVSLAFQVVRFY